MANINGIGDLPQGGGGAGGNGNNGGRRGGNMLGVNSIFGNVNAANMPGDARKESFFDMLRFVFCPAFSWKSFVVIITLVEITVFCCCILYGGIETGGSLFQITYPTLNLFGGKIPWKIRYQFQLQRLVTPMLLHANF